MAKNQSCKLAVDLWKIVQAVGRLMTAVLAGGPSLTWWNLVSAATGQTTGERRQDQAVPG